jgi:hypothetical protein
MFKDVERLDIAVGLVVLIMATAMTLFGTNYTFHKLALDKPSVRLTKQGTPQ